MNEGKDHRSIRKFSPQSSWWRDLLESQESEPRLPPINRRNSSGWSKPNRRRIDRTTLFGEILDFMLAPLLLLWPLSIALTFLVARALADAPFDQALSDRVVAISQQVGVAGNRTIVNLPRVARDILRSDQEDLVYFQVIDSSNRVLAGDIDIPPPGIYDFVEPNTIRFKNQIVRGEELRVAYMSMDVQGPNDETFTVQVAETLNKRSALANEIIRGVILPQFIILPLSVFLVWFGLKRGLRPVTKLQMQISSREPNDLSAIDDRAVPEEIAPVVESFNELLSRLNQNAKVQQRFIADAAHQLKTPLAGLQTNAELALRQQGFDEQRITLRQLSRSANRTARLVTQLLALARAEHHRTSLPMTKVELDLLAKEVTTEWVNAALAKSIDLGFEPSGQPYPILGQSIVLRELMNNLIDNAIRYTPQGGTITVRVYGSAIGGVRFEIEDNGPGIAPADLPHIFERFFTILGNTSDGSGLGLAIVKEIADQHDAQIKVYSHVHDNPDRMPHGTRITVIFPT